MANSTDLLGASKRKLKSSFPMLTSQSLVVWSTDLGRRRSVGSKRKLRSEVCQDFDLILVYGVWKARCKWCKKDLSGDTRNATTSLKNHLGSCDDRACRKVTLEKYVFVPDVARKELALMIIVHEYPLSMVDHEGFKRFCA
ncbi:hypothetical protein BDA96_04G149900, partial [Sorghum bicolor]